MIRTNFQSLIPPHNQPRLLVLPMLQQPHIARSAFLPLPTLTIELEQLGTHLECLLLSLLVRLGLHLFGQVDDGLEVDIWRFGGIVLYNTNPHDQLPVKS